MIYLVGFSLSTFSFDRKVFVYCCFYFCGYNFMLLLALHSRARKVEPEDRTFRSVLLSVARYFSRATYLGT